MLGMHAFRGVFWLLLLPAALVGCTPNQEQAAQEAPASAINFSKIPQKLPLDEGLQRLIKSYAKKPGGGKIFCLEFEKLAYDSLQFSLYSGGHYVPIIDLCRPNFYAEFDDKLILIATGAEFVTPGSSYRDTYRESFYKIATKKVLGKAYTPAQYDSLHLTYGPYDPPVWRVILHVGDEQPGRIYTVVDSFALPARDRRIPPPQSPSFRNAETQGR